MKHNLCKEGAAIMSSIRILDIHTLGIIVTYNCNLNCTYCYISNKRNKKISLKSAKNILEPFLNCSEDVLQVLLIGGEPLLCYSQIKELILWVENGTWKRKCTFFMSTNGTLLDEEMKAWFSAHNRIITLALSYDGLASIQNSNRSNSSSLIDLNYFLKNWPQQKIQMTVNSASVSKMAAGVLHLLKYGFFVNVNVAYEEEPWSANSIREYAHQLKKIGDYYLENPPAEPIYQFQHPYEEYADEIEFPTHQKKQCGAGDGYIVFDTDGKPYACHMFSPLVINSKPPKISDVSKLKICEDIHCQGCPYIVDCPTCMGCNWIYRGDYAMRDKTHCFLMQIEVMISMKYELNRIARYGRCDKDDKLIVAIEKLMAFQHSK